MAANNCQCGWHKPWHCDTPQKAQGTSTSTEHRRAPHTPVWAAPPVLFVRMAAKRSHFCTSPFSLILPIQTPVIIQVQGPTPCCPSSTANCTQPFIVKVELVIVGCCCCCCPRHCCHSASRRCRGWRCRHHGGCGRRGWCSRHEGPRGDGTTRGPLHCPRQWDWGWGLGRLHGGRSHNATCGGWAHWGSTDRRTPSSSSRRRLHTAGRLLWGRCCCCRSGRRLLLLLWRRHCCWGGRCRWRLEHRGCCCTAVAVCRGLHGEKEETAARVGWAGRGETYMVCVYTTSARQQCAVLPASALYSHS